MSFLKVLCQQYSNKVKLLDVLVNEFIDRAFGVSRQVERDDSAVVVKMCDG